MMIKIIFYLLKKNKLVLFFTKVLFTLLLFIFISIQANAKRDESQYFHIDPKKNSILHNDSALLYVEEKLYDAAIKEYLISLQLNPKKESTGIIYYNLALVYFKVGHFKSAQYCLEQALKHNPLNFLYCKELVKVFKAQKILQQKSMEYRIKKKENYLNAVIEGMILIELGQKTRGIEILKKFIKDEPDIIITEGVKKYIIEIYKKDLNKNL